jgi:pimeloyl-ACP methyl ester carboxylesterase
VAWRTETVGTASCEFIVRCKGDGPHPLLYLHDEFSTACAPFLDEVAGVCSVSAPVLPGFGSARRPEWVQSIRDVAACLMELVDQLPNRRLTLVGASMGAWAAAEVGLSLGDRVDALVLLGPMGIHVPGSPPADHWFVPDSERDGLLFHDPDKRPEVDVEEWIANDESAARYGWHPRFCDFTLEHRIHRVVAPTVIIVGEHDRLVPRVQAQRWAGRLPNARIEVVPNAGHYAGYEQPAIVGRTILSFLGLDEPVSEVARA